MQMQPILDGQAASEMQPSLDPLARFEVARKAKKEAADGPSKHDGLPRGFYYRY